MNLTVVIIQNGGTREINVVKVAIRIQIQLHW